MIIKSLLDLDWYKFTMAYFAWKHFPDVEVEYRFTNRTKRDDINDILVSMIPDIKLETDAVRELCFTDEELVYLSTRFEPAFIDFLKTVRLPSLDINNNNGLLDIRTTAKWPVAIWWETIVLCIVNELFSSIESVSEYADEKGITRNQFFEGMIDGGLIQESKEWCWQYGKEALDAKIKILKEHPLLKFSNFGTRRRYSREWQFYVDSVLAKELSPEQFIGTSNVYNAWKLGINPIGTNAHELYMICSRLMGDSDEEIVAAHGKTLDMWMGDFGPNKSTALTDTFGTKFFFDTLTTEQALQWLSFRHDSGDPIKFGEYVINFFESKHIDTMTKTLVFSDGLNLNKMIEIFDKFKDIINVIFGWGTNLTNDMGITTLSIVMKPFFVDQKGLVKLSDNLNKITGPTESDIERAVRIYKYDNTQKEVTIY